ncbi:hypothetical protein FIE12Z_8832 [Fusarium flagelliforme]|uniref:Uncharacterized protein n=1 Tax=Fusarium flagelliforme TaxID=2675880 RepID=A0A395MIB9_9HYPO|nr:hypothetical protein FIE12Z_8832 [Fusarium flagelliforme]
MLTADTTFHDLSVVNPGFATHPITWTEFHLRVVDCTFNQITDNVLLQAPEDKARTASAEKVATRYAHSLKSVYVADLLIRRGSSTLLSFVQEHPAFYFAGSLIHRASGCDVYRIDKEKLNAVNDNPAMGIPEPIFGYYRYDIDNVRRKRHTAPGAPRGMNNDAVQRIYDRRLARMVPQDWRTDPYITRLLVTNDEDHDHAYVYKADIPWRLLKCLHHPTRSFDEPDLFPSVSWVKVPFKPYDSFSERIVLHLVGVEHAPALQAVPDVRLAGQRRKFGETEEPSESDR